jgi:uncharacterized protein (DUF433 family)
MSLVIRSEPIPLETDQDGVIHVSGTRVTLDTLVTAFNQGATPEEIAQQYPSVPLPDIYAVISFYLHRQSEVEGYLEERRRQSEAVRRENESRANPAGIRERLLARRTTRHQ